ncbi:MAG: hypothetical protein O4861_07475 [Trichodesmium sp. St16_bin4-tuft]|nr:hypothetical protein [Trichodesmium sp. MAG_R01]MDE5073273.1 hypothetical protein [Trichodesmium sp. St5_bin8]MDE5091777.1 hypothetical protein [Trichodesmium sp. St18_bin3_1_1]MDE5098182.1 hypothetical protein [Trichodesmium sp. St16_bin4-tuft]MDE5104772.1 hypothetical protein [Trichodesmium sp. St19_bin2]
MLKEQNHNLKVVKLTEGILVRTQLKNAYIPALRSGFAGYPVNPRWSGVKFWAWKRGKQWRKALLNGEMVVRSTDSILVSVDQLPDSEKDSDAVEWLSQNSFLDNLLKPEKLTV